MQEQYKPPTEAPFSANPENPYEDVEFDNPLEASEFANKLKASGEYSDADLNRMRNEAALGRFIVRKLEVLNAQRGLLQAAEEKLMQAYRDALMAGQSPEELDLRLRAESQAEALTPSLTPRYPHQPAKIFGSFLEIN